MKTVLMGSLIILTDTSILTVAYKKSTSKYLNIERKAIGDVHRFHLLKLSLLSYFLKYSERLN